MLLTLTVIISIDIEWFGSQVVVGANGLVYELIGEISLDSSAEDDDDNFERYLLQSCSSQVMVKTKQTLRKTDDKGQLISTGGKGVATKSPVRRSLRRAGHDANCTGFTSDEQSESEPIPQPQPSKQPKKKPQIASKDLSQVKRKLREKMQELCRRWNRRGRIGLTSETARGWLKKGKRQRNAQGHVLRRMIPGHTALREIKHYQRCRTFLIPQIPFHRLVREVCNEDPLSTTIFRWQVNALFTLQCATEAYISGFYSDVNLCALHRNHVTIGKKDIWLAVQIRGTDHVGGKGNMSDTGLVNTCDSFLSDPSEKMKFITCKGQKIRYQSTPMPEWNKTLMGAATPKAGTGASKMDPGLRRHRVIRDNLQSISQAALARLARKGGVKRMAGNIHDDIRGAMKIFLKHVVQDAITYAEHVRRKTITVMDVVYALKNHGRNMYGFTREK